MYLGRYRQGDEITLPLHATDASPTPLMGLSRAPSLRVYSAAGAGITGGRMYARDRLRAPGLFSYRLFLDGSFPAGRYLVSFSYSDGGVDRAKAASFDVVAGGGPLGFAVSARHVERPHAGYLVTKTTAGKRRFQRGPYL